MPGWRTCLPAGRIGRRTAVVDMIIVYALRSTIKNYIYVGMTGDLERRIKEHNSGKNKSTKAYQPFVLIYTESFPDRVSARLKEKYLKSGSGKEFLKALT